MQSWKVFCIQLAASVKATLPLEAPPMQVELKLPVGHTARAARTQPSHLPLLTLIVAPETVVLSVKSAVPDEPVVEVGLPPHFVMVPALISSQLQIANRSVSSENIFQYGNTIGF